jgi:hypothetical protein
VWLRVLVLRSPWGELNSDEAYTGLAAMGVLDGRWPVVIDGAAYTAVLDAYAFAPVTLVAGGSILALKLLPIVMWAAAAIVAFGAGRHLGGERMGAVAGALVWLAPGALLVVSTLSYVSYASGMAATIAVLWQSARVIDAERASVRASLVLGALAGLAAYLHPMYLAAIIPALLPTMWRRRQSVRAFWIPFVGAGVTVNVPFLLWNAVNGWPSASVTSGTSSTYIERLEIFVRELVPRTYGMRGPSFEWVLGRATGWALYGVLVTAVVSGCVAIVRSSSRPSRMIVPITALGVWPLMATLSHLSLSADGRYGVIAFPAVALAVAGNVRWFDERARWARLASFGVVGVWLALFVWPHTSRSVATETVDANAGLFEVIDLLDDNGVDRVAGSYWRVLTTEYASDLRIQGAVLTPPVVRFAERQRQVQSGDPTRVAFLFELGAEDTRLLWMPPERYQRVEVGDTVVYLPRPAG